MVKNPPANAGDVGSTLGLGRFPWKEMAKSLEYSCLENSMDRGAWRATVHGATKSLMQLNTHPTHIHRYPDTGTHTLELFTLSLNLTSLPRFWIKLEGTNIFFFFPCSKERKENNFSIRTEFRYRLLTMAPKLLFATSSDCQIL